MKLIYLSSKWRGDLNVGDPETCSVCMSKSKARLSLDVEALFESHFLSSTNERSSSRSTPAPAPVCPGRLSSRTNERTNERARETHRRRFGRVAVRQVSRTNERRFLRSFCSFKIRLAAARQILRRIGRIQNENFSFCIRSF